MRRILVLGMGSLIALSPARSTANPAIIPAAPAICATGVGCVLLGVTVIGGVAYHVWRSNDGKRTYTRAYTPEPGDFEKEQVIDSFASDSINKAIKRCKFLAKQRGMRYVDTRKTARGFQCIAR